MITKVQGQTPFQVLTNNFSISPSQEGYTLQISADGKEFSDLFAVAANTTRLVSNVAANSYYRLSGNQSEVSVNWMRSCVTEGGGEYILPPATETTLGGVKIGSGITVTADGTISADGENKTVVDFDTTTQAERASLYTELKPLYDGGSGSSINKNYDFYKTVDTKQGLKIDYYTFADGKLVFGKVVSPNNSADTIVYEQVVLISADGSVEVVTNTVGRPYTAGANISINNQNQISVSGLSTINGSAITAGGNIVIGGGDKLMPVGELPATADTGTVMATSGSTGIGKWSVDGFKYTFTILDTDHSKWATRQKIAEMHPGYLAGGGDLTNIYCRYFDGGEFDPYWEFYFENSDDESSSFYLDEYDEFSDTRYDFIQTYAIPPEYEEMASVSVEWNNLTHQFTIYSDMDAYADPVVYLPMVNTENYPGAYFNTFDVGTFSERGVFQFDGSDWQSVGSDSSSEEIELPIAAAVNDLKGNIEARLSQKYYTRQEVNDIAAGKTDPAQVGVQIENYVNPAIAEVKETIVDKELPVSAALNDLNTNKVSGVGIAKIQSISQADYDALTVKDPTTFYIIKNN